MSALGILHAVRDLPHDISTASGNDSDPQCIYIGIKIHTTLFCTLTAIHCCINEQLYTHVAVMDK